MSKFMLTALQHVTWILLSPRAMKTNVPSTGCTCWYRQVIPNKEFLIGRQVLLLGQLRPGTNSSAAGHLMIGVRWVITSITAQRWICQGARGTRHWRAWLLGPPVPDLAWGPSDMDQRVEVSSCTHAHLKTHDKKPQIVDSEALICEQLGDVILPRLIGLFFNDV